MIVYKYPFGLSTVVQVPWPTGSRVLHVAAQRPADNAPTLWVEHPRPPSAADPAFIFDLIGTGRPYSEQGYLHVGSAVCAEGGLVWHVFRNRLVDRA